NAALIHKANDLQRVRTLVGTGPGFRSWFKNSTNENEWFWPMSGFQEDDSVYVYLSALRKTAAGGLWGFENTAHDFRWRIKCPGLDRIEYVALPGFEGINFGYGLVREDPYIFAYGGKRRGLRSDVFVARFKASNPETAWSFWDGNEWNAQATQARPIA